MSATAAGEKKRLAYLDVADRTWPLLRRLMGLHTAAYRLSGGRLGSRVPGVRGRMLLLEHVGAKTGARRTSPLLYFADGEDLVIVASKGGFPANPAWFHNLRANPETEIQVGSERRAVRARVADAEERERLWPEAVLAYRGYADYASRTDRTIPLVILEPR